MLLAERVFELDNIAPDDIVDTFCLTDVLVGGGRIVQSLFILDDFSLKEPRTKLMAQALDKVAGSQHCLVVYPAKDDNYELLARAINNLPKANLILADYLNIRDLLGHEKVILVKSGLDRISEILLRE